MFQNKKRLLTVFVSAIILAFSSSVVIYAQPSSSNFQIEEFFFGTGGEVDSSSTNFRARQSVGALGVGNTSSPNYDAEAGFTTQNEEFLEMTVTGASVNFGTLDPSSASSGAAQAGACNCTFFVKSFLSSSYSVVTASQPPTNESGDSLAAKAALGVPSSDSSVEEFGINLVDNASPDIGANLANQPDNTFADGEAATDYDTVDQFKYAVGDTIARSQATPGNPAIGLTEYTISYIAKPSNNTPAGVYTMDHDLIVTPTF